MPVDSPARIDRLRSMVAAVCDHRCPYQIAIAFDHAVCAAKFERLVGKERGVNPAEDHVRAASACDLSDLITSQRICGMNSNSYNVAAINARGINRG